MRKTIVFLLSLVIVLTTAACGKTEYKPVAIDEAVDKCPICNMAVADDQFATEIILTNHKALKFDDLGDLFVWKSQNGTKDIGEQFVRDYHTKEWIKLTDAFYVYDESIRTPMAYNVISFKEKTDAEAFVTSAGTGEVWDARKLDEHHWQRNEAMMKHMMQQHAEKMTGGMEMGGHEESEEQHKPMDMTDTKAE